MENVFYTCMPGVRCVRIKNKFTRRHHTAYCILPSRSGWPYSKIFENVLQIAQNWVIYHLFQLRWLEIVVNIQLTWFRALSAYMAALIFCYRHLNDSVVLLSWPYRVLFQMLVTRFFYSTSLRVDYWPHDVGLTSSTWNVFIPRGSAKETWQIWAPLLVKYNCVESLGHVKKPDGHLHHNL